MSSTASYSVPPDCPVRMVLDRISDRWSLLVMIVLSKGTFRFGELSKYIPDISTRMLSQTLRRLEQDGLITRKAYATIPPKVEYRISALGQSFFESIQGMVAWAETNKAVILAARSNYIPPESHTAK